jgi:membrane protein
MPLSESMASKRIAPMPHLGGLPLSQLARNVLREISTNNVLGRSSELAFEFLFALVPLLLFMLTVFGLFASRSLELRSDLLDYFHDFLPGMAFALLRSAVIGLATNAGGGKLALGIVIALWFASGGIHSMISSLNSAYHVAESRPWWKVRVISLALTLLLSVLLLSATFLLLVSSHFLDWLGAELGLHQTVVAIGIGLQWPAAVVFVLLSYSLIYYFGPDLHDRRWRWLTPGTAFGAFLWLLASVAFRVYLHFFNTYDASYGSLGAVMILLVWLYVTGFAFLLGGEINAEIGRAIATRAAALFPME